MVNKMWIKRNEYERLCKLKKTNRSLEEMNSALEEEIKRLSSLISSQNSDCKIGPWCNDCIHVGRDRSVVYDGGSPYAEKVSGEVIYCTKHIHDMCPEFENSSESYSLG